jgi:hypothetical protein
VSPATATRRKSLIVPREHGAWGILLVPLATGAAVGLLAGGRALPLVPLTIAGLALFWMRTPLENWIGTVPTRARSREEITLVRRAVLSLSALALGALVWLLWGWRNGRLLGIGAAALVAFAVQALIKRVWRGARTAPQTIGAAGLTAVAPAAYCAVTGRVDGVAWALWAGNLLFAFNQIQYVHLRIQAARAASRREKFSNGRAFCAGQVGLTAILAAACAWRFFPWLAAAAFLPLLVRGFAWFAAPPRPLAIHTLGKRELYLAIAFGLLLSMGFAV